MDEKLNINERKYTVVLTIKETGEKYTSSTIADHFDKRNRGIFLYAKRFSSKTGLFKVTDDITNETREYVCTTKK